MLRLLINSRGFLDLRAALKRFVRLIAETQPEESGEEANPVGRFRRIWRRGKVINNAHRPPAYSPLHNDRQRRNDEISDRMSGEKETRENRTKAFCPVISLHAGISIPYK